MVLQPSCKAPTSGIPLEPVYLAPSPALWQFTKIDLGRMLRLGGGGVENTRRKGDNG